MSNEPNPSDSASASPFAGLAGKIRAGKSAAQVDYETTPPKIGVTYRKVVTPLRGIKALLTGLLEPVMSPALQVELDGVVVGSVECGKSIDFVTTPGQHQLRIHSSNSTESRDFQVTNGQRLRFWCLTSISGIVLQRDG